MSGVEAIIGLVAGGAGLVSLAIQLIESTAKLKRIYHAAQDAPTTLSSLTFDLETIAMALRQLDQHRQAGTPTETLLARCMIACQRGIAEIKELVDKLETCLARHKNIRGKLYTAFKQHDVRGLLDNLEKAKSSLHFAYTMYLAEEQKLRDLTHSNMVALQSTMICDLQTQMQMRTASLSDQLTPMASHSRGLAPIPEDKKDSLVTDRTDTRNPPRKSVRTRSSKSRFRVTFQLPNWISRRTYDIALVQLQYGWDVLLRTYNVVPYFSPIFDFVAAGNLARVRGLLESGYTTPLDVRPTYGVGLGGSFGPWQTLLEILTLPSTTVFGTDGCDSAAQRRLMETILRSQAFTLETRPVQTRFELASRLEKTDAATFLKCVGLDSSDPILAVLRNSMGKTVLHVVAHHVHLRSTKPEAAWHYQLSRSIQRWLDLGLSVLKNGADPSSLAEQNEESWPISAEIFESDNGPPPGPPRWSPGAELYTPLLVALGLNDDLVVLTGLEQLKRVVQTLQIWAEMVQSAGLDLCLYGASENEILKSLGVRDRDQSGDPSQMLYPELVFGATPEEWSFKVIHTWSIGLYELQAPPGAFPTQSVVPSTIAWSPTPMEIDEGHWVLVGRQQRLSDAGDVRHISPSSTEPFIDLVETYQDDAGVITLMQYRASRQRSTKTRSNSQPPILRRKELAYRAWHESWRKWLQACHFCPGSSSWRFGCVGASRRDKGYNDFSMIGHSMVDVRCCVRGIHSECSLVQQSYSWSFWSFLAGLTDCQDNTAHTGTDMGHDDACPWPAGCRSIPLDRLNVPEDLRWHHPRRRYFPK
ncbi:hypothetical protein CLCR_04571 [Cladophialophora carrionii]|uniref:Fungal N-terminal domain-containing protein n=1 Tax=Cladophialophora carrionii TaxID=86049 RepID=A0A1C1CKL4_9EURO|nr:hypothetical protein CLCR_04571 [Cladophialophora carrionii]